MGKPVLIATALVIRIAVGTVSAQTSDVRVPEEAIRFRQFLYAAYPNLDGRAIRIETAKRDFGSQFRITEVIPDDNSFASAPPASILDASTTFTPAHDVLTFAARGPLASEKKNRELAQAVKRARAQRRDVDFEINARSPQFGLAAASALRSAIRWELLSRLLGTIDIVSVTPLRVPSDDFGFVWSIEVTATHQGDGSKSYVLQFEPFTGALVSLTQR